MVTWLHMFPGFGYRFATAAGIAQCLVTQYAGLLEKRVFIRPFLVTFRFKMIMTYICACLFSVLSIIGVVDEWTTEMDNEAYEVLQSSRLVFYLLHLTIRNSNAFLKLKRPISSH